MYIDPLILDHFYLETRSGSLCVVVGNWHIDFCILGYVKYSITNKPTLWANRQVFYDRLVKKYDPGVIRGFTEWSVKIPFFDQSIPCIPIGEVAKIYNPLERSRVLLSRVRDSLEAHALSILLDIYVNTNTLPGVTGSLLPGIHNVRYSDIDLVVYGVRDSLDVVEYVENNKVTYSPFNDIKLKSWSESIAANTSLAPRDVSRFYRNWRRGIFENREYSIIYNDGIYRNAMSLPSFRTMGVVKIVADVYGGVDALNYPSRGDILVYRVIEYSSEIPYEIKEVLSYEALYIPGLYEGGIFEINGLIQCSAFLESCRVLLGAVEYKGYMRYYD